MTGANPYGASPIASPSVYLAPAQLAARWGVSTRSLERWRADRSGPAWIWIGGSVRYALVDVEAYETRNRRETAGGPA